MSNAAISEVELRKFAVSMIGHMGFVALHFFAWIAYRESTFQVINYLYITIPLHLIYLELSFRPSSEPSASPAEKP